MWNCGGGRGQKTAGLWLLHSPTMSWPVPGTLMIEPTALRRSRGVGSFCDALLAIRAEIKDVEDGAVKLSRTRHYTMRQGTMEDVPPTIGIERILPERPVVCLHPSKETRVHLAHRRHRFRQRAWR